MLCREEEIARHEPEFGHVIRDFGTDTESRSFSVSLRGEDGLNCLGR